MWKLFIMTWVCKSARTWASFDIYDPQTSVEKGKRWLKCILFMSMNNVMKVGTYWICVKLAEDK